MSKVIRTLDAVYGKADKLSFALLDVPDLRFSRRDNPYGTLLMDRWTYQNFMSHPGLIGAFDIQCQNLTWRGLLIERVMTPVCMIPGYDVEVNNTVSFDDEPFLMSIRYEKENGRICYLDDPDTDEVYK